MAAAARGTADGVSVDIDHFTELLQTLDGFVRCRFGVRGMVPVAVAYGVVLLKRGLSGTRYTGDASHQPTGMSTVMDLRLLPRAPTTVIFCSPQWSAWAIRLRLFKHVLLWRGRGIRFFGHGQPGHKPGNSNRLLPAHVLPGERLRRLQQTL